MNETDLVRELARAALVPENVARTVLHALFSLVRQGRVSEDILLHPESVLAPVPRPEPVPDPADPRIVDDLIAKARLHPLGVTFLREGYVPSVAAKFGAHAFTVEAAKRRLESEPEVVR